MQAVKTLKVTCTAQESASFIVVTSKAIVHQGWLDSKVI